MSGQLPDPEMSPKETCLGNPKVQKPKHEAQGDMQTVLLCQPREVPCSFRTFPALPRRTRQERQEVLDQLNEARQLAAEAVSGGGGGEDPIPPLIGVFDGALLHMCLAFLGGTLFWLNWPLARRRQALSGTSRRTTP